MGKLEELEKLQFDIGFQELKKKFLAQIVETGFNLWFYNGEFIKPKTVSKTVAEENVALYQKHLKHLTDTLNSLEEYEREITG